MCGARKKIKLYRGKKFLRGCQEEKERERLKREEEERKRKEKDNSRRVKDKIRIIFWNVARWKRKDREFLYRKC